MFGVFVQVAGGEDESLAKEAISRGMVDFYVLKGGENGLVERNLEELLRSARELMRD